MYTPLKAADVKGYSIPGCPWDVHLYAFTTRAVHTDGTVTIRDPLAITALGSVLKKTDYFRICQRLSASDVPPLLRD